MSFFIIVFIYLFRGFYKYNQLYHDTLWQCPSCDILHWCLYQVTLSNWCIYIYIYINKTFPPSMATHQTFPPPFRTQQTLKPWSSSLRSPMNRKRIMSCQRHTIKLLSLKLTLFRRVPRFPSKHQHSPQIKNIFCRDPCFKRNPHDENPYFNHY